MNHNHPVFPQHPNAEIDSGITKREYFALYAMQALIDNSLLAEFMDDKDFSRISLKGLHSELVAKASCAYADALLKELENDSNH